MLVIIGSAIVLATFALSLCFRPYSAIRRLPSPAVSELVWGHEKLVFSNPPGHLFRQWTRELGLTFRIRAALGLVLSDPLGISYLLQKRIFDFHHSRVVRPRIGRLLGKGLGWVEGEAEHRRMKQLVMPSLTVENIKGMSYDIVDATIPVMNDLTHLLEASGGSARVNVLDLMNKVTLNVIGRVAFLHDFEGGNSPAAKDILSARSKSLSGIARYSAFLTLMLLRRFPVLNDLPIPALQAQGIMSTTIKSGIAREIVRRHEEAAPPIEKKSKDLLSILLTAVREGRMSEAELYEQWISRVGGQETTSFTLAFSVLEISRNPHIQERLRNELASIPGEVTYEDFESKLPYLDAVMRETLRMYPALAYMERVATKSDAIPVQLPIRLSDGRVVNEVEVHPGQTVIIPIIAIHRSVSVWGDPDVFRPERWLEQLPAQKDLVSGWSNLLSFSNGPRTCIGRKFAIYEYKQSVETVRQPWRRWNRELEATVALRSLIK
ncbi:cytochrome P450 [Stereum hirsutum FP-91666 SS1]|uniref:cytochrome P450 n=1 Tax=Stereum hirsutum (strain FP-91666) TaxID=721885 RepID=UPI0004449C4B|nr:cytochrome P450 [Stereum hirsutum FP-91666 SS1]EIM81807.1 cytochrome P450 [Stereum hirsutum FP-91666 SS1]